MGLACSSGTSLLYTVSALPTCALHSSSISFNCACKAARVSRCVKSGTRDKSYMARAVLPASMLASLIYGLQFDHNPLPSLREFAMQSCRAFQQLQQQYVYGSENVVA